MPSRVKEIVDELRGHIAVLRMPTITKSVFNEVDSVGEVEAEDQIMLKADAEHPVVSFSFKYGNDEYYQVFVLGGHYK